MRNTIQPMIPVLVVVAALFGCEDALTNPGTPEPVTVAALYHAPITTLVGQEVAVLAPVTWDNAPPVRTAADPDTLFASPLVLDLHEVTGLVDLQHPASANIRVVSPDLDTTFDGLTEVYRVGGHVLQRERKYVLTGTFAYRDWLSPPPLDNPAFLEQSNKPAYWSQTFEFKLLGVTPFEAPADTTD